MTAKDCTRFDSCSAPLCPADAGNLKSGIFYPDEETCTLVLFRNLPWVKNQRKITKKVRNKDFYFTKKILDRTCVVTAATEGLNPDKTNIDDTPAVNDWLKKHPSKREVSEIERQNARNRMFELRNRLTLSKNSQKRQEIYQKVAPETQEKDITKGSHTKSSLESFGAQLCTKNAI